MRTISYRSSGFTRTLRWAALTLGVLVPACSDSNSNSQIDTVIPDLPGQDGGGTPGVDGGGPVQPSPLLGAPPLVTPTTVQGTETPVPANYWPLGVDKGLPPYLDEPFRALVTFQLRNQAELEARVAAMYDPASPQFRKYLSVDEFMANYAPAQADVDAAAAWLTSQGFTIARTATNRMFLFYTGDVDHWNKAFGVKLHYVQRAASSVRDWTLAPLVQFDVPQPLVGHIKRLIMPDVELPPDTLPADTAPIDKTPPSMVSTNIVPSQTATAYGLSDLYAQGYKGAGMTLGVIGATAAKNSDLQSMWQTFGITRSNPVIVEPMEPMYTRGLETALDLQLAGAMAPEAKLIFYGGPNTSDTTLLYVFNEAIARNEAQVLTDSFAHAEASSPVATALTYDESALIAAALGITVVSAAGDSNQVDTPASSPYVTAVGGTNVDFNPDGTWKHEQSWELGGCGLSRVFAQPLWQKGAYANAKGQRTNADVSMVVGPSWVKFTGKWTYADGTSGASPVFAATMLLVDQARKAQGKPPVGFITSLAYQNQAMRNAFRDITEQGSGGCAVSAGYDLATGVGSPKANELATAIP